MARLTERIQAEIVVGYARFRTPSQIKEELREVHGVEVPLPQIAYYNPEGAQGSRELHPKWRQLFAKAREDFVEEVSRIPIANQAYRLQVLQDELRALLGGKATNWMLVNQVLEQAAKESGGMYTNRRILEMDPREALAQLLGVPADSLPEEE